MTMASKIPRWKRRRFGANRLCISVLAGWSVLCAAAGAIAHQPALSPGLEVVDVPMFKDPELVQPAPQVRFDPRHLPLWLAALRRPEFDMRLEAAEALRAAHRQGVPGLNEAIPLLLELLERDTHSMVRFAAARALVEFDCREAAPALLVAIKDSRSVESGLVACVDGALVSWDYPAARASWRARLADRREHPAAARSAIVALGRVHAVEAGTELLAWVNDAAAPLSLRLEAARALGSMRVPAAIADAEALASGTGAIGPLLGLLLCGSAEHETGVGGATVDPAAIALAQRLVSHEDPRVRAQAVALLAWTKPQHVLEADGLRADPDDQVRLQAVKGIARCGAGDRKAGVLLEAFKDISEPVRVAARGALAADAREQGMTPACSGAVVGMLGHADWREVEQAAELAGDLRLEAAADALVALLGFDRPEVRLAAARALRKLAAERTCPSVLERLRTLSESAKAAARTPMLYESIGQESVQLWMMLAALRFKPAEELLRTYCPKRSGFHPLARGAAIYALGKIHEGQLDTSLATEFAARLADNNPLDPEAAEVRRFAAVGLARMGARDALSTLREFYEAENTTVSVGGACRWAIMKLEGIELLPCSPVTIDSGPFFLRPLSPNPGLR